MIRRILLALAALLVAAIALPPLWFAVFGEPRPSLPPPDRRVVLPGGVHVNVLEDGAGPPVVLVHGLPGSAYDWRLTLDAVARRGRRAIAYDRVGFGHSQARPDDAFTLERNAEELLALLDALGLRDASVVGWSYGGGVALRAAHRDASRIGRLVLVGSIGPGMDAREPPPGMALLSSRPVLAWMRAVPPVGRAARRAVSDIAFSGQPLPDWWLPSLGANLAQPRTATAWREEGRRMDALAEPPDPAGLSLPVLVVHGDDDRLVPVAIGRALAERATPGRLRIVEGGSHMLPVTHPELLAEAIVAFEDEPASAAGPREAAAP
jgi:2-hydroxymuconate-semialdehyde hydrolase